jgi:hypothetical protein
MYIIKCQGCDCNFESSKNGRKFCNKKCSSTSIGKRNINRKHTEESKNKISNAVSGSNNGFYNKQHTEETKLLLRTIKEKNTIKNLRNVIITKEAESIIDGILISDGSLTKGKYTSRISFGFKYKETNERIIKDLLKSQIFINYITETKKIDKRTNNQYISYHSKSLSYYIFLELRKKWYTENVKKIPDDLQFTPLFLYWWFVCDGFKKNKGICFCTESFNNEDLLTLQNKFYEIGIKSSIHKNKRMYLNIKNKMIFYKIIENEKIKIQDEYKYKFTYEE